MWIPVRNQSDIFCWGLVWIFVVGDLCILVMGGFCILQRRILDRGEMGGISLNNRLCHSFPQQREGRKIKREHILHVVYVIVQFQGEKRVYKM